MAQETETATLNLSLKEAIAIALENNQDIIIERYNPLISETDVESEKGAFSPTVSTSLSTSQAVSEPESDDKRITGSAQISKKFPLGANVTLSYETTDNRAPGEEGRYSTDLALKLTQSILKGFGSDINLTNLWIARKGKEQSEAEFVKKVVDTVAEVQNEYWDIYNSIKTVEIRLESFALSEKLSEKKKLEVALGVVPSVDLLDIESDMAGKVTEIYDAKKILREKQVRFKTLLGLPLDFEGKPLKIHPSDSPNFRLREFDFEKAYNSAIENHPDYIKLKLTEEVKKKEVRHSRNQTLPDLELNLSYGLNNSDSQWGKSVSFNNGMEENYEFGLMLSYPLGNKSARSNYRKKKFEAGRIKAELKKMELSLKESIANAIIAAEDSAEVVKASIKNLELKKKNLEAGEKRLKYGTSNMRDFLDTQTAFIETRLKLINSEIEYQKALVNYYKAQGIVSPQLNMEIPK